MAETTTVSIPDGDASSSVKAASQADDAECFLCCEGSSHGTLVTSECKCRDVVMHLHCQQKMLEYSYGRGASALRCGGVQYTICERRYAPSVAAELDRHVVVHVPCWRRGDALVSDDSS